MPENIPAGLPYVEKVKNKQTKDTKMEAQVKKQVKRNP